MRFLPTFIATVAAASLATLLAVGGGPKTPGDPKVPTPSGAKKGDEKKLPPKKIPPKIDASDEDILRRAELSTDGDALLQFLRKRILPEKERPAIEQLARRLASPIYRIREHAMRDLIRRGPAVNEMLRSFPTNPLEAEQASRIWHSLETIREADVAPEVPAAAVRVLAARNPPRLIETLFGYLPFADNEATLDELRIALTKHALKDGKADPLVVAALSDRSGIRRATAAEVLARVAFADHKTAIRKALADADPLVRFRAARALTFAKQRDALPTLIDTLPDLPLDVAWQAEDFLLQLAAQSSPPSVALGKDRDSRSKCKDAWQAWWKKHAAKVDLAKLEETPKLLGRTLIVLLDLNTILELGPDNMPRWQLHNINFPLDAQLIGEDRVLAAEYRSNQVTERDLRGNVVWQKGVIGPLAAQRLPNGNTFVATDHQLLEFDKAGNETMNISFPDVGRKIMKAAKLPNGEIACMTADSRITRFDARGREVHSFPINLGMRLYGGRIHMLPSGRVLVPHNSENKVVEYDSKGKIVWEVAVEQPIAATRLPNGHTLITSMNPAIGAVEFNRAGAQVWSYRHSSNTRVTRAIPAVSSIGAVLSQTLAKMICS